MLEGFLIGHADDQKGGTGVTVLLAKQDAVGGVSVRGASPATRETDLLRSENTVERINAVVLSGGSAYGLEAACGVTEFLKEKGLGYDTGKLRVPIVCGASIYDLEYKSFCYPDKEMGKAACLAAAPLEDGGGMMGAGAGATVGKLLGMKCAAKSGIGIASIRRGKLEVAAVVVVNAFGNVYEPDSKHFVRGCKIGFKAIDIEDALAALERVSINYTNTTIGCILTNAKLSKADANRLADATHDAYSRCIRPVHTRYDGDAIFVMANGDVEANAVALHTLAVKAMSQAILNAVSL